MANVFVVKTQFKGADRLSPILKKIGINVERTGRTATKSFKRATKAASIFGGVLKGNLVSGAITRGVMAANNAIRGLTEEFVDFDRNITKAVTRLPGGLDRSSAAFKQFGQVARDEAKRTEFTAGEAALAVEQLALAGFNLEKTTAALPGVLNLATNADVELADATRMATKTLGAFGLNASNTTELIGNLTHVNDVFSKTVSSASITMEDFFEVIKFGGPSANAAGQSIETFAAATAALADSAVDASVAGTSLRSMFINLAAPTPKATKLLRKMKVEVKDSQGNFRNFFDIMSDVEKGTKGMGNAQKLAALNTLFGKRAVNAANILLNKGTDELKKYRKGLENSAGAAAKMSKTIRTSIEGRLKRLKSALVEVGFKFIEAFNKGAGDSIEDAIKAVSKFDVKPVVAGLKDIIRFSKELFFILKPFLSFLPVFISMWVAYKAAMLAVTVVEAARFFVQVATAMRSAAAAQGALNLVMAANPIALVTIAIVGLTAALAILITKNDDVTSSWESMFSNLESFASTTIAFILGKLATLHDALAGIGEFFGISSEGASQTAGALRSMERNYLAAAADADRRAKEAIEEVAGVGVQRGIAGIRGATANVRSGPASKFQTETVRRINPVVKGLMDRVAVQTPPSKTRSPRAPQAPNRTEIEAKQQSLRGTIEFKGAPQGTTFKPKKGPGLIPLTSEGLGANG
jgi:TP901 family phage tail tape measure protein